ncbi:hypothetical protein CCR75_006457 [Bremia lactucae]|uniref:ATPase family AAA domain-containing protein 2 n=1 Tax=Bremia lactucae TaxID=4779 RepID=A0A976FMV8_BRELC|nr:hypothetical protein CCR75_006457 [Bremia lactucae]
MSHSVLETAASSSNSDSSPVLIERHRVRVRRVASEEENMDSDATNETKKEEEKVTRRYSHRLQSSLNSISLGSIANHKDASGALRTSSSRYSLRTRHSNSKRFDESMYNDVFTTSRSRYAESTPESLIENKRRRRRKRNRRETRQRREDEDEDGEDQYSGDSSSVQEIEVRQVKTKKRDDRVKARAVERQANLSRYSLRSRDSLQMSEASDVSLFQADRSKRASKRLQVESNGTATEHKNEVVELDDEEFESEKDAISDDEEENEDERKSLNSNRYHLRQRRSLPTEESNQSTRSRTRMRSMPVFEAESTLRRYSLRDRSKLHRTDVEVEATASPETSATYAEYQKRRLSSKRNTSNRQLFLPDMASLPVRRQSRGRKHARGRRTRQRRSLSSSTSTSTSSCSSLDMNNEESDGGMRTSSPWRSTNGGRKSGRSRADITPVEVDRSITWHSVGGLKSHIEALKEMVMLPLLYPEFYGKFNVAPPSGVLFYGPPGTGKTLLARALANSCSFNSEREPRATDSAQIGPGKKQRIRRQVTFYMRKGADCLSKWVGEAERQLRLLFEEAKRNQPSIIFFDEIDGLAPVRSAKQDQIHASIVSTLLALMDGMDSRGRVVVIGATNRLDAIDPALRRPGRFDRELGFKLPNVNERKSMLVIHSKCWNPPLSDSFLSELAEQTVGYCGADIKALCAEAALSSLRRVYPQVYASEDKLLINLDKVVVARGDFAKAARKITPASHRAVSSFASPLPQAVKELLQEWLRQTLRDVERYFPLFPLGKSAIDDAVTTVVEDCADRNDDNDEEDLDIYTRAHHEDCDICHGPGTESLLRCDACPGACHRACLLEMALSSEVVGEENSGLWFCLDCQQSGSAAMQRAGQRPQRCLDRSLASLQLPRHVGFPRILVAGKPGMGQQYIGPALLHSLEGLSHFSLDYPSLVADSNSHNPEEALIKRLSEAQRCLPCVLYLPQIELWWTNTSESMHLTLTMMLMNLQARANLPLLFLACTTSSCDTQDLPDDLLALFNENPTVSLTSVVITMNAPISEARMAHFDQVFRAFATPPAALKAKRTSNEKLKVLPLAPLPSVLPKIELSPEEQRKRKERDCHFLRELRIFLGQVLHYCCSQKMYTPFYVPVDPVAVPNYYLIVKRPMDLSTIRDKLNDKEYTCFEQFMDDIQLIVRNANVFNPKRCRTRHIAHAAGTMKDNILSYAHRFRIRQGYDLFAKCREVTKRLRAHPQMYGEFGQRFLESVKRQRQTLEIPHVRTSARLRGVKAPEISLNTAIFKASARSLKPSSNEAFMRDEVTILAEVEAKRMEKNTDMKLEPDQQWFTEKGDEVGIAKSENKAFLASDCSENINSKCDEANVENGMDEETFAEGDRIFVSSRTHPGINREGGAGVVQSHNRDGSYNVKYILGGSEKSVSVKYIKRLTDDAIMESVKTQRSVVNDSTNADSVRFIQDEERMDETDYFDELLWPLLKEEGWKRDDKFDIIEASGEASGLAVQRVVFTPGKKRDGELVTLHSVVEALSYISEDPGLSLKCFGTRFAERMLADEALGKESSDDETDDTPQSRLSENEVEEKIPLTEENADKSNRLTDDVQETPIFVYDEVGDSYKLCYVN